ncbi:hypothetical protein SFR_4500 [Streptomyces sp. FR-008]|nr:hypothetical protein SFR_4500 [Streptomyces sp. FR-008]
MSSSRTRRGPSVRHGVVGRQGAGRRRRGRGAAPEKSYGGEGEAVPGPRGETGPETTGSGRPRSRPFRG